MSILSFINPYSNNIFKIISILSVLSLALAFFVEYGMKVPPCELCLMQRIPYLIMIIISLVAIISKRFYNIASIIIILSIFSSIVLSGYHSSIERGLISASDKCNPDIKMPDNMSNEEIKEMLYDRNVATCTKAPFKILMLSMTEWNFLFNFVLLIFTIAFINRENNA